MGEAPLSVGPRLRPQLVEDLALRLSPERPRGVQNSSPARREFHRLDAPVGMRTTFDQAITLQQVKAASQCRLVDGEPLLELLQVRLAHLRDRRENAELSHPDAAR